MSLEKICQSRSHKKSCWNKISFILTLVTDTRKIFTEKINCLIETSAFLLETQIIEGSQLKYPTWSEFPKYLSFRSIHKVWKFETNQRQHSTGLEWNKLNRWDMDPGLGGCISNYSSADYYLPCDKSFRSRSTELKRYPNPLFISVEDGRLNIWWVWPSVLWFCVQRMEYGWEQHTQSWGGRVHSTAPTLCADKSSLHKPWLWGKNKDDVTVIRVFLLSTSIISRVLPALAMERSPAAWIGSKAPNRNTSSDLSINLPTAQTLFSKRPFRWTKFSVYQNSDTIN